MRRAFSFAVMVAITLGAGTALAQFSGLKGRIQDQLNGANEERNREVQDAANGQEPTAPRGQPTAQQQGIKSGWLVRHAQDGTNKNIRLYFAYPNNLTRKKPTAGLLVLQEWWGVNDDIQERTREFANKGYYAVAPDLYNGQVAADATKAAELKKDMTDAYAMGAMKTGLDLLAEEGVNGVIDSKRVGAIGWCMGGQQALLLSLADPRVKATAIFYGPLVTDAARLKALQGPVLGVFGNNDTGPSPADVSKFKEALKAAGKSDVTIYQFDGVGHAFASKSGAKMGLYNEEKAKEAWAKTWEWLDKKLPR
jgi:carboxymethylenebutenolidase